MATSVFKCDHGEYIPVKRIASGAFGDVWLAKDAKNQVDVVVKETKVSNQPNYRKAYRMELSALQRIQRMENRPDIVKMIDYNESALLLVEEYVEAGDLFTWLQQARIESIEEDMRYFMSQLLQAFRFIHSIGILHRDIKPQNVLLRRSELWTPDRAGRTLCAYNPVLADFGTAKLAGADNEAVELRNETYETYAGTPAFMAPEVSDGDGGYTDKIDVYSFGAMLVLTFNGGRARTPIPNLFESIRGAMSRDLADLLYGMLHKNPELRFSWDQVAAHRWFQMPFDHARKWLESQEAHAEVDRLARPATISHEYNNDADSLDSSVGIAFIGLSDALAQAQQVSRRVARLHEEWTTDRVRFYDVYGKPWEEKILSMKRSLAFYEPFKSYITMRTIFNVAAKRDPNTKLLLLLEVGRVAMMRIRSFSNQPMPMEPGYIHAALRERWIQLMAMTQESLKDPRMDTSQSSSDNTPLQNLLDAQPATVLVNEVPFYAIMHSVCIYNSQTSLMRVVTLCTDAECTPAHVTPLITDLRELRLMMEYAMTQLPPSLPSVSSASSSSSMARSASSSTLSNSHLTSSNSPTPVSNCQDFIDRITNVIRMLQTHSASR